MIRNPAAVERSSCSVIVGRAAAFSSSYTVLSKLRLEKS